MEPRINRRGALLGLAVCGLAVLPSCGWVAGLGGSSNLRLDARNGAAQMSPAFTTSVYAFEDDNTVDVVMTDLPIDRLLQAADGELAEPLPAGSLVRVHMFMNPRAGYTPIDYTAANATVTYAVVAGEVYGVYSGAGFLLPSSTPGEASFSGQTSGANLKLASAMPGFDDKLGPCEVSGRVAATRDDDRARKLSGLLSAMARYAVATADSKAPAPDAAHPQ